MKTSLPRIPGVRVLSNRLDGGFNVEMDLKMVKTDLDTYQRKLDPHHVDAIACNFTPAAWRDPILSYRGGKLLAVEGNHELNVARKLGADNPTIVVNAILHVGLTIEQEANLFLLINGGRKRMDYWGNFRAGLIARNIKHLQIMSLVEASGLTTPLDGGYEVELRSVRVLTEAYKRGENHLRKLLAVLRQAWRLNYGRLQVEARTVEMQRGLSMFLAQYPDLSVTELVRVLRKSQNNAAVVNAEALELAHKCSKARGDAAQVCKALQTIFGLYGHIRLAA